MEIICINGRFYRPATFLEVKSGVAFWTGSLYVVEMSKIVE